MSCDCCGKAIPDTPEENVDHTARGCEVGFGLCRECGGYPEEALDLVALAANSEIDLRTGWPKDLSRKFGRNGVVFYEARFDVLREKLNEANRARFEAMTLTQKIATVYGLIQRGAMI